MRRSVTATTQSRTRKANVQDLPKHLVLAFLALASLFPMYFVLTNSFKNLGEFSQNLLSLPTTLRWENYLTAWQVVDGPLWNSTFISVMSVLGILLVGSVAAYAFARLYIPGKNVLYVMVLLLLFIPSFLTLIPLYLQLKKFGLGDNHWGLILTYIAAGQAFCILVMRNYFQGLPRELFEAAHIDGASDLQIFTQIALPLSVPALISVGIISFIPVWNDLLLPQLVLSRETQTVTMALVGFQNGGSSAQSTAFGPLMAGYVLASLPLVLIFSTLMRYYINGITSGAVKG
ncbi:carbohydrate ABC transporter permease [Deinococcus roseus]|uniref:Sugar ABC transporter permease n=1 Tax=Deinococcus roseus TaxID=392414 RepID=A0ABQ2DHQ8_9DEIO|nr:carbohydrate ABC transporter permease [Deinococcus roseus]GGJ56042.1 sugar ABC transporter permease [Deinococcus roseus]